MTASTFQEYEDAQPKPYSNNLSEIQKQIIPSNLLGSLENINCVADVTCGDTGRPTLPAQGILSTS